MEEIRVSRQEIIDLLESWQRGVIAASDVYDWAENHYVPGDSEFEDWEDDNSVTLVVLASLDLLPMNLMVQEDIPIYIEFLKTPPGEFELGYTKWDKYMDSINYEKRKKELSWIPFYEPFCG